MPYTPKYVEYTTPDGKFHVHDVAQDWDWEEPIPDFLPEAERLALLQEQLMDVTPSRFAEFAVRIRDAEQKQLLPFSFGVRGYLRRLYDTGFKRTLFKCGRQVEKSTTLGNKLLCYACINVAFNALYVSPSNAQTKTFSNDRLKEPIVVSPHLSAWTNKKLADNVFLKKFINRSQVTLRYAFLNADRVRGIPADLIAIDEIQDVIVDNIPVIEECASHSPYKLFMYSGTPKSLDNTLEYYWENYSTQNEFVVPCEHHGTPNNPASWHWNILDEDNIGPHGLMCDKCHRLIDPTHPLCQWAAMNPEPKAEEPYEGYRIPQLMVPWTEWDEILQKQRQYSRGRFYNEVLGMSFDSGTRPLTQIDVVKCCYDDVDMSVSGLEKAREAMGVLNNVFMGVDWGCHDEETRLLTADGFKYFRDVTPDDLVAQFDKDTRKMTFVRPEALTVRDWKEPLYHWKAKGLDMMLSDPHRMLVRGKRSAGWKVAACNETAARSVAVFRGYVDWEGDEVGTFRLPGLPTGPGYAGSSDRVFLMDDWLELLGYWLSEGGLCYRKERPSCIKMSQRESVSPDRVAKMAACMDRLDINYSEFPNPKTGDVNWTICGKNFWHWWLTHIGPHGHLKRIPREFLGLSKRQLRILFDAMLLGDGSEDPRENNYNGAYTSTSKGLCEDFQELCIRLGLRSTLSLHKPAEGNRKTRWRVSWSRGRDFQFNRPKERVRRTPYNGKVYCCKVPSGFIVTERNGRIAYQGNTGEGSYTVMTMGAYLGHRFTIFYVHKFEGRETDPRIQISIIKAMAKEWRVRRIGVDYGGGFWPNDILTRTFGMDRVVKYQYSDPRKGKVIWEEGLKRFLVHRSEVMSDIFAAIKRGTILRFPRWDQFKDPYAYDLLNIFSEYNEQRRCDEYKKTPGTTDDTFHSILYCFLVSMIDHPRADVIQPLRGTS